MKSSKSRKQRENEVKWQRQKGPRTGGREWPLTEWAVKKWKAERAENKRDPGRKRRGLTVQRASLLWNKSKHMKWRFRHFVSGSFEKVLYLGFPRIARVTCSEELGTMSINNLRGPIWGTHYFALIFTWFPAWPLLGYLIVSVNKCAAKRKSILR